MLNIASEKKIKIIFKINYKFLTFITKDKMECYH